MRNRRRWPMATVAIIGSLLLAPQYACLKATPADSGRGSEDSMSRLSMELLRSAARDGAVILAEAVLTSTTGKPPRKMVHRIPSPALAGKPSGVEGLVVIFAASDQNLQPQKAYNKIIAIAGGKRNVGKWLKDLGGAVACLTVDSSKVVKVVTRGKAPQVLGPGDLATIVTARLSLSALGMTEGQFLQQCKNAPDLIRGLL